MEWLKISLVVRSANGRLHTITETWDCGESAALSDWKACLRTHLATWHSNFGMPVAMSVSVQHSSDGGLDGSIASDKPEAVETATVEEK